MVTENIIHSLWNKYFFSTSKVADLLEKHFDVRGDVQIDPQSRLVNVTGNVILDETKQVTQLPVQFGTITGSFDCKNNKLTSLQGAPHHVGSHFWCMKNQLTSLQGAPTHVGGSFWCYMNQLTSLEHAPTHVGSHFYCQGNLIQSLAGSPTHLGGSFDCSYNKLTSLDHAPHQVDMHFNCRGNVLQSVHAAPVHVGRDFNITYHDRLPLLPLLKYPKLNIFDAPDQVKQIMSKYAGAGKSAALNCALELKKAGYAENARW